jgi:nucleotide-binding universal stress UspA family protein
MKTSRYDRSERIIVGIDGSLASRAALRWAIDHARPGDHVTLLHVWRPSPSGGDSRHGPRQDRRGAERFAARELDRARLLVGDDRVTLSCEVSEGDPRAVLAAYPADLVVIGVGRHGRLIGAVLGSVGAHLDHHCNVPVVMVPCPIHPAPAAEVTAAAATGPSASPVP